MKLMRKLGLGSALGILAVISIVVGAASATVWVASVSLPSYVVQADGSATITERGLAQIASADVAYAGVGAVVGLLLGILAWVWFEDLGWPVAFIAAASGLLAGAACWIMSNYVGPGPFDARLAAANPGDAVPIAFGLRAHSALALWGFAAVAPALFASSLGPEIAAVREAWRRGHPPAAIESVPERTAASAVAAEEDTN